MPTKIAVKTKKENLLGKWAFLIGVVLAIIIGLGFLTPSVTWLLLLIGIVIGLFNITNKETKAFLMSGTVLIIVSALGQSSLSSVIYAGNILEALLVIFVPATIVVAIKNVWSLARE